RDVSEATLQDDAIAPLCDTPQSLERDGWRASYLLTSSDGLELRDVSYQGRPQAATGSGWALATRWAARSSPRRRSSPTACRRSRTRPGAASL
ncbi:hypothetical protein EKD04_025925, partial [Chloroflexales bacterium ZM16-3]|nr:hypothetical protein [Chloroflexales bacterium ZM16-3]